MKRCSQIVMALQLAAGLAACSGKVGPNGGAGGTVGGSSGGADQGGSNAGGSSAGGVGGGGGSAMGGSTVSSRGGASGTGTCGRGGASGTGTAGRGGAAGTGTSGRGGGAAGSGAGGTTPIGGSGGHYTTTNFDLCAGRVSDLMPHPMTALAKPALGATVVDAEFGTTIRRITAVAGTGASAAIKPMYTTIPADCDGL